MGQAGRLPANRAARCCPGEAGGKVSWETRRADEGSAAAGVRSCRANAGSGAVLAVRLLPQPRILKAWCRFTVPVATFVFGSTSWSSPFPSPPPPEGSERQVVYSDRPRELCINRRRGWQTGGQTLLQKKSGPRADLSRKLGTSADGHADTGTRGLSLPPVVLCAAPLPVSFYFSSISCLCLM